MSTGAWRLSRIFSGGRILSARSALRSSRRWHSTGVSTGCRIRRSSCSSWRFCTRCGGLWRTCLNVVIIYLVNLNNLRSELTCAMPKTAKRNRSVAISLFGTEPPHQGALLNTRELVPFFVLFSILCSRPGDITSFLRCITKHHFILREIQITF